MYSLRLILCHRGDNTTIIDNNRHFLDDSSLHANTFKTYCFYDMCHWTIYFFSSQVVYIYKIINDPVNPYGSIRLLRSSGTSHRARQYRVNRWLTLSREKKKSFTEVGNKKREHKKNNNNKEKKRNGRN